MRFPARLTLDLALHSVRAALPGRSIPPAIFPLSLFADASRGVSTPLPVDQCLASVARSRAPIVWIAGPGPLTHPDAPRIVDSLVQSGHRVFLEAAGELLRRRIHEFRPSSCFFFALQFQGSDSSLARRHGSPDPVAAALEGLRVAKLSGFLACARVFVRPDSSVAQLEHLRAALEKLDIDGLFLSPPPVLARDYQVLARLAPHRRWNRLGMLADSALALQPHSASAAALAPAKTPALPRPPLESAEESAPLA